jgi:hypothetical protein
MQYTLFLSEKTISFEIENGKYVKSVFSEYEHFVSLEKAYMVMSDILKITGFGFLELCISV